MKRIVGCILMATLCGCGSEPSGDGEKKTKRSEAKSSADAESKDGESDGKNPTNADAPTTTFSTVDDAIAALASRNNTVVRRATEHLAARGEAAVAPLAQVVSDENADIAARLAACRVLGDIGDPAAPVLLAAIAPDGATNVFLRRKAVETLGAIEPARAETVTALIAALDDEDAGAQRAAIVALGNIGTLAKDAADKIIEIIRATDDKTLRALASEAVKKVQPRKGLIIED